MSTGNPIYRIRLEVIGEEKDDHKLSSTISEDIECDGFAIVTSAGGGVGGVTIHHMTALDIASGIAADDDMFSASILAKAMREAVEVRRKSLNPIQRAIKDALKRASEDFSE